MKNFKRITKRGLSLFVALLMCMSVMSLTAFAEDEVTTDPVEIVEQVTEPTEETQDPVEVVEPVEDETPAEDPAPIEGEAPVEEETPAEDPASAEDEAPAEEPAPAEDETPGEGETPTEDEAPTTIPTVTSLKVTVGGTTNGATNAGSQVVTIPNETVLSACTFTLTTSESVTFEVTADPVEGEFCVSSVTGDSVKLNLWMTVNDLQGQGEADLRQPEYALTLEPTNTNKTEWSGRFTQATMTVGALAALLPDGQTTVTSGIMNGTSQARVLLANCDADDSTFILCAPEAAVHTLTFMAGGAAQYTWKAPVGYDLSKLPALPTGYTGWYADSAFTGSAVTSISVSGNQTLYAKPAEVADDFLTALKAGNPVTIDSPEDWEIFAANSAEAREGQLVTLDCNLTLTGTYDSLVFKGNFDGGNHTISGATFREVASAYNSSSESDIYCSGMFASIGAGQIIANLKLDGITAQSSRTYAGILAGLVDGSGSNPALIRNIQVTNGTASGRSAAGITGFLRNATVIYCSSRGTTITGIANGGGIVGINNAVVSNCYSTTTPTAWTFMKGTAGGITGKNVRGGRVETSWTTMAKAVGGLDSAAEGTNLLVSVTGTTPISTFTSAGFGLPNWKVLRGTSTTFTEAVNYDFSSNS